jgi:hypothetical protein
MKIAVDFDGTVVQHEYPEVGVDVPGAVDTLKKLAEAGHLLTLYTMRSGYHLEEAAAWFRRNDIPLYGIQKDPEQEDWTSSNKCYAEVYIDDAAFGAPLVENKSGGRPYLDWSIVDKFFFPKAANKVVVLTE